MTVDQVMAELGAFWALVAEVWDNSLLGLTVGNIVFAIAIMALASILRHVIARMILNRVALLAGKTSTSIDDVMVAALEPPIRFIPIVIGAFLASQALAASGDLQVFLLNVNRSLITITIFWTLYRAATPLGQVLQAVDQYLTEAMIDWLIKTVKAAFLLIGAAAVLEIWGIEVGPIIAGLGLFGVAVALGAQDLFKNLIAGLFIISERRFLPGDWILVDGIAEGTVEQIGFRTTTIRRFDKAPVYVPNSQLSDSAVTNFGRMTFRRIRWTVGLEYRTSHAQLEQVRAAIERFIHEDEDFVSPDDASTFIKVDGFAASSIDLMVYCFTKTTVWGEWLDVKQRLAFKIKEIVEEAGASFAFPSQSLYVESLPDLPAAGSGPKTKEAAQ